MERPHGSEVKPALPTPDKGPGHQAGHQALGEMRTHPLPLIGAGFLAQIELQTCWLKDFLAERKPDNIARGLSGESSSFESLCSSLVLYFIQKFRAKWSLRQSVSFTV